MKNKIISGLIALGLMLVASPLSVKALTVFNTNQVISPVTSGVVVSNGIATSTLSASSTLTVLYGGTGSSTLSGILKGNGLSGI